MVRVACSLPITVSSVVRTGRQLTKQVCGANVPHSGCFDRHYGNRVFLGFRGVRHANSFGVHNTFGGLDSLASTRGHGNIITYSTNGRTRKISLSYTVLNVSNGIIVPGNTPGSGMTTAYSCSTRIILRNSGFGSAVTGIDRVIRVRNHVFVPPCSSPGIVTNRKAVNLRVVRSLCSISGIVIPVNNNNLVTNVTITVGSVGPAVHIVNMRSRGIRNVTTSFRSKRVAARQAANALTSNYSISHPNGLACRVIHRLISSVILIDRSRVEGDVVTLVRHGGIIARNTNTLTYTTLLDNGLSRCVRGEGAIDVVSNNGVSLSHISRVANFISTWLVH